MLLTLSEAVSALTLLTPGVVTAGLAMAALCLLGHFFTHHLYIQPINLPDPWPAPPRPPEAGAPKPLCTPRRLVVFLVDGLGEEPAATLPNLGRLRDHGASARVLVGRPSFTDPGMACYATGLPPSLSGIRINGPIPEALEHDSVATVAARAGLRVSASVSDYEPLRRLLFLPGSTRHGSAAELTPGLGSESAGPGELIWLYTVKVDEAGHWHGGRSEAYAEACQEADRELGEVMARLDLERDALIVLSDHGHRPRGGHGGPERELRRAVLVAAGCGIAVSASDSGEMPAVAMHRIAPTLTAWLGLEPPRGATGVPIRELFGGVSPPSANRVPTATGEEREARRRVRRRLAGAVLALAPIGLLALALAATGGLDVTLRDGLPVLVYLAMTLGLTTLAGWPLSYSMPRGGVGYVVEINLYGQLSAWLAAWLSRPERLVAESLVGAALFLGVYLIHGAFLGRDRRWLEPPPTGYLFILLSSLMFFFGLVSAFRLAWHLPTLLTLGAGAV